jgi:hypothetical protein
MLGSAVAAKYFTRLLLFDERHLIFRPELDGFLITHPAVQQPLTHISNRPALLFDYRVRDYGTVVPQRIWAPATAGDVQRYSNVPLKMPIFLVHGDREIGLRLVQAAAGHGTGLLDGHAPAPVGNFHTIIIRIKVSVSKVSHRGTIV